VQHTAVFGEAEMFAAELFAVFVAAVLALLFFFGLLTAPAYLAVRRLMLHRFTAPLERGKLERRLVLGASVAAACSSVLYANAIEAAISGQSDNGMGLGQGLLLFIAPVPLGFTPWAAGELLGGESETPGLALMSCFGITYALGFAGFLVANASGLAALAIGPQFASTSFAALGGATMYLAMRGEAIKPAPPEAVAMVRVLSDYSSSMSENLSLRGASSGFF
jgi:hypothetical protein